MSLRRNSAFVLPLLLAALQCAFRPAIAQSICTPDGYRVLAEQWDPVLGKGWELRQNCAHPEWPAHIAATRAVRPLSQNSKPLPLVASPIQLVHAGDSVRLWLQDCLARIEMSGVAEQSGRSGDRVVVRITRQTDEDGTEIERFTGIVRAVEDVEMER